MSIDNIIKTLHPLERKVMPVLDGILTLKEIVSKTNLLEIEVMRALQWLQNKKLVTIKEKSEEIITLSNNGAIYAKKGLPELRFLRAIVNLDDSALVDDIAKKAHLQKDELNICLGLLRSKLAIDIKKNKGLMISITEQGRKLTQSTTLEESFLNKCFPLNIKDLKEEEKFAADNLLKRKDIIKKDITKQIWAEATNLGKKLIAAGISNASTIDRLTPALLKSGKWKDAEFRAYDVKINVPSISSSVGRRHYVNEVIEYVKRIWLDLGFKEMKGPLIQSSFWNFDALFTAQDHPVRDMQDTFFIENPSNAKLPNPKIVEKVKKTHEDGWNTNSKGWGYKWDPKESLKNVLRTHTTCLSVDTLSKLTTKDLPAKFFSVGKVFRNETLDWKHLFEFYQTDCIVVDPGANLRHLIGYLKEFFNKMGYPKVRVRPAYFPYTEPSAEVDVFHPVHKQWIELGGAGLFRPEVVRPLLGQDIPVLAWGLGLERIVTEYYRINDLRDIYSNDLKKLRTIKSWLR